MFSGVAFCPQPPLLLPVLSQGAAAELAGLRACCAQALRALDPVHRPLVLLGAGASSACHRAPVAGTLAGFGVARTVWLGTPPETQPTPDPVLSSSLTVGAWLVGETLGPCDEAYAVSVGPDFASSDAERQLEGLAARHDLALVVLGDGSARRSASAPGYLDERAADFDAAVAAALRSGEPASLGKLDAALGEELLAAGVRAWHAAGQLLAERTYDATLRYDQAPYGVGYFVASWSARG